MKRPSVTATLTEESFVAALSETIAWAAPRIDASHPRWSLRSADLRPPNACKEEGNPGFFNCSEFIQHVRTVRSSLISKQGIRDSALDSSGRLLIVDYAITNHNQLTEDLSNGFFDWADNPPWDLWVCEMSSKLVCWIPTVFVAVVEYSMSMECMGMLAWVTDKHALPDFPSWLCKYSRGI